MMVPKKDFKGVWLSGSGSGNPRSPETLLELSEARVPGRETQALRLDEAGADFQG